ncbi:hypothetical protein [Frigoribacterium sp. UYMn621]|uniref:hypothetical protein n=1 Tax=Frigoribacterium sp. UYMn621 TaxID=3156343 RepID=UPI0033920B6B
MSDDRAWTATDRDRALQHRTLELDEQFTAQFLQSMRDLVASEYDHNTFIEKKMDIIREWDRQRKLAQHNLGYQFDPKRRKEHLLRRDIDRELQRIKKKLTEAVERRSLTTADADTLQPDTLTAVTLTPARPTKVKPAPAPRVPVRSIEGIPAAVIEIVSRDTGIADLESATDDQVREAYRDNAGYSDEVSQEYLDMLNGIHPDWLRGSR